MAKPESQKRQLKFENFDQLLAEVDSLLATGYISHGKWNLSQACGHIGDWMRFPIDGFPKPPWFMVLVFWTMKHTVGNRMKQKILSDGFKGGMPTAPETVPAADAMSDRESVAQFHRTVERLRKHNGPLHPSPLFGPMDHSTLEQVSLLHAAHHLAYLEPVVES